MARRSKENAVDWDAIRRQYRLGKKSNTQLSDDFKVSVSSIGRKARDQGWVVDKSEEVDAVTNALLIQNASGNANPNATPTQLEIKAAAQTNADVVLGHRKLIGRTQNLFTTLLEELEVASDRQGQALLSMLIELTNAPDEDEDEVTARARMERMRKQRTQLLEGSNRIDSAKRLTEMLEKLVRMEREAFGIDNNKGSEGGYEEMLRRVLQQAGEKS